MHKQMIRSEFLDLSFNCDWERECKREANLLNKRVLKWESISGTGVGIGGRVVSRTKSLLLSVHFLDDFKNIDEADISVSLMKSKLIYWPRYVILHEHKWCYIVSANEIYKCRNNVWLRLFFFHFNMEDFQFLYSRILYYESKMFVFSYAPLILCVHLTDTVYNKLNTAYSRIA